jgi:DNA repair exonuclease SbcCD ATPase subunit
MIKFKKIRWKNFLSTGNTFTEIQFDKTNTTLILGENGAGKSTLLDALTFVLFNKPYRNINLPQLVSSVNEKDCLVEIEFTDGKNEYRVIRGQAPKTFEIWKEGKLLDQDSKSKDGQRDFEENILGMNYKSFCQVVILGSANYVPFMRLTAAERRAVVESILDIGVFSAMNTRLKERISINKEELQHAESSLAVVRERVTLIKKMVEDEKKRTEVDDAWIAEQVEAANKTIENSQSIINECIEKIDVLTESISDQGKIGKNHEKLTLLRGQIQKKLQTLNKEIGFYQNNDNCPTCSQKIADDFKNGAIEKGKKKAQEMDKALNELHREIEIIENRILEINEVIRKVRDLNTLVIRNTNEIESARKNIGTMTTKKTVRVANTDEDLKNALSAEQEAIEEKRELIQEQHYLSLASTLLKDSGIKSRIIKNYIPVINSTINKYLTDMNFFVNFHLDEEFNETIKSRHRDVFTYASFSEGEKKKIDLALLFAWRSIASMKNSITTNLLILDEILDGSLDDQATESFLDIMGGMQSGTNTFVISHKPKEILQDKFDRCIQFAKKGNFSRITQ